MGESKLEKRGVGVALHPSHQFVASILKLYYTSKPFQKQETIE